MKIFKYTVPLSDDDLVQMPKGATIISVQTQNGIPMMWALVDETQPLIQRRLYLRGTGHEMRDAVGKPFIGTFQIQGGVLVFHLFDGGEASADRHQAHCICADCAEKGI